MDTIFEFSNILGNNKEFLGLFSRDKYEGGYKEFCEKYSSLFSSISEEYEKSENKDNYIDELTTAFISPVKNEYEGLKKSQRSNYLIDKNLLLVVYILPAINGYHGNFTESLLDSIIKKWNDTFNQRIKAGTYEDINAGFKRKLCYVTTAVCQSLGKDEACKEINLLKNYRDTYLILEPDGAELIEAYYDIAPTIVNRINKCEDSKSIYENIYFNYINPCVNFIENSQYDDCKKLYVKMMHNLKDNYMI